MTWKIAQIVVLNAFMIIGASVVAACENGVEIFAVKPITANRILHSAAVGSGERSAVLSMRAAAGEIEPGSVVIAAGDATIEISLESPELVNGENVFPRSGISVRLVQVWYQAGGAWETHRLLKHRSAELTPELLVYDPTLIKIDTNTRDNYVKIGGPSGQNYKLISTREIRHEKRKIISPSIEEFDVRDAAKLGAVSIPSNEQRQFWLTARVPIEQEPGVYTGTLEIQCKHSQKKSFFPVELEVLPFALGEPILEYSIYYRGKLVPNAGTISSEYKNRRQLAAEFENLKEHGVSNPSVYQRLGPHGNTGARTREEAWHWLTEYMNVRRQAGLRSDSLYYLGRAIGSPKSPEEFTLLDRAINDLRVLAERSGMPTLYLYGRDEARKKELSDQAKAWMYVKSRGARVFAAGRSGHTNAMGTLTDTLVLNGERAGGEIEAVHEYGGKVFSYSMPQVGVENPITYRLNYGFKLWQDGYDGAMNYAYQHAMGFIWNDFDHEVYRDHVFAYPTADGVLDTIAWEGFREGVDDVRYLSLLLSRAAIAGGPVESHSKIMTDDIARFIRSLRSARISDPGKVRSEIISFLMNEN